MTERVSQSMSLSQCLKAYKLYVNHEKKGLIKINKIGVNQADEDNFTTIKTGKNRGKLKDDSKHQFFVEYEKL